MQLVSNDSHTRDASETEPILPQFNTSSRSTEATSSCEIQPLADDRVVNDNDQQNLDADESCSLVNASQPICRICFDSEGEDLIAPCDCKGTQKYVHRSCLDHWRSTKEGFAFAHCTECRALFELRANVPPDRWLSRLKFQLLVIRDHALIFVCVQLIVAMFGMLVYKFYGTELREMFGYEEHPYGFYTMAVLAIILVGLLYGFFIAIICGQKISERHYHVLAKQELTKVIFLSLLGCSLAGIVLNLMRIHEIGLASFRDYNFPPVAEICTGMRFRIMVAANFWPILDICLNINICVVACLQEFVVVSREENDNVAPRELDPTHVTELRTLGLY